MVMWSTSTWRRYPQYEFILCWAHMSNKFALTFEANKDADAEWFVMKIGEL